MERLAPASLSHFLLMLKQAGCFAVLTVPPPNQNQWCSSSLLWWGHWASASHCAKNCFAQKASLHSSEVLHVRQKGPHLGSHAVLHDNHFHASHILASEQLQCQVMFREQFLHWFSTPRSEFNNHFFIGVQSCGQEKGINVAQTICLFLLAVVPQSWWKSTLKAACPQCSSAQFLKMCHNSGIRFFFYPHVLECGRLFCSHCDC